MEKFNILLFYDKIYYFNLILSFILSTGISFYAMPWVIKVTKKRQLVDKPKNRSSHQKEVPTFGGVAVFFAVIFTSSVFIQELYSRYTFLLGSLLLLFFIGALDDMLIVSPRKKLFAQILAGLMIAIGSDVRINNFFGILGLWEIPYIISILLTVFCFIVIINAYNLIDGIDGLAGLIGIVICLSFAYVFFRLMEGHIAMMSFILMGSLISFLYFNLSSRLKIFMGDTGSMFVGFLISFMAIRFIDLCIEKHIHLKTAPVLAMGILIIPLLDTANVFIARLLQKKSPFAPDRNHLHHKLLEVGLSHKHASFLIAFVNIIFVMFMYLLRHLEINILLIILLITSVGLYSLLLFFVGRKKDK